VQLEQFATTPAVPGWGGSDRQQVRGKSVFPFSSFFYFFFCLINQPLEGSQLK
jgi:hypothetical protein